MAQALPVEDPFLFVHEAVMIEPVALNEEFIRLPSDLARWGEVFAEAIKELMAAKCALGTMDADLFKYYKQQKPEDGSKPTEKWIDACVEADPRHVEAQRRLDAAEYQKSRTWGVLDAIRAKREMLVSLGANHRSEMQYGPTINIIESRIAELERKLGRAP